MRTQPRLHPARKGRASPITYRTFVDTPRAEVFHALATADGWNAWFNDDARIEPRAGGRCWFRRAQFGPDHVDIELEGEVLRYEPNGEFAFRWPPHRCVVLTVVPAPHCPPRC